MTSGRKRIDRSYVSMAVMLFCTVAVIVALSMLFGCQGVKSAIWNPFASGSSSTSGSEVSASDPFGSLSILSGVGGLSIVGGIVLLVVTRGSKGWLPFVAGIVLILLNAIAQMYLTWLAIPVLIGTGAISLTWAGLAIHKAFRIHKTPSLGEGNTCSTQSSSSSDSESSRWPLAAMRSTTSEASSGQERSSSEVTSETDEA